MSRSLGSKVQHKLAHQALSPEAEGRKMFADGLPCPPDYGDHGKAHARQRGWRRAAAEARQPKNRKPAQRPTGHKEST
ncbi:hypothetical protein [Polaromonas sp.]|uniref:hypothetical protein n=1 Tax=Polaromonas sp. TaxID=1869339 RepID=UPI00352A654C